MPIEELLHWSS